MYEINMFDKGVNDDKAGFFLNYIFHHLKNMFLSDIQSMIVGPILIVIK